MALNTVIWGSTFVMVKEALNDVSPLLFLALRFSLAAFALGGTFLWLAHKKGGQAGGLFHGGIIAGCMMFAGYVFQTTGLKWTSAPNSAFLTGLAIPLVPLLAGLVYRKGPHLFEVIGVIMATLGMALLVLPGAISEVNRGDLLTIACAVAFAGHIVATGYYSRRTSFESLSLTQVGTSATLALASFWWMETPVIRWRPEVLAAITVTGLLATALAFTIQVWAQQYTTATRAALIFSLEPVFAWLTSFLLTGESLSRRGAIGAGFILFGIVLAEMKPANRQQHPSS